MTQPTLNLAGLYSLPSLVRLGLDWLNLGMKKSDWPIRGRVGNKSWPNDLSFSFSLLELFAFRKKHSIDEMKETLQIICKCLCLTPAQVIIIVANSGLHYLVANQLLQETVCRRNYWPRWNTGKVREQLK